MKGLYDLEISEMPGLGYDCKCGQTHKVGIENIIIGQGAIEHLPEVLEVYKGKEILIVADKNTYRVAGNKVEDMLKDSSVVNKYIFDEDHFIPDERALGRLLIEMKTDTAIVIAVGAGSINDISRYISYKQKIPYIIVCTAPSMDGYASVVSPLIVDGVKTTYNAVYPKAIVADLDILKEAPMHMLQAGLGDILGKYTALADWQIARVLNNEYYCDSVAELVLKAVDRCVEASVRLKDRECETIKSITEALLLSGIAIGMVGASRPASGEEHHLSHCWEMIFMDRGMETKWLHGNYVGVGVGIAIEAYKYLESLDIEQIYNSGHYADFDKKEWVDNLTEVYGKSAKNVIAFKESSIHFEKGKREERMKNIVGNWKEIKRVCNEFLPEAETVRNIMKSTGAPTSPLELGIDKDTFRKSFIVAKDIRNRYGILQLLEDIGKLEEAAECVTEIYYK
jgi:glycerol-1-phosphate dehydrogenase [NAD(P)+]